MEYPAFPELFADKSSPTEATLEFVFQIRLFFTRVDTVGDMPSGAGRGAVYVDDGVIEGPRLNGRVLPGSGGDWALFRPDGVLATPDVIPRIQDWMFRGGPPVPHSEFYLRSSPSFEVAAGKHDWLMRHIFVGVGERFSDGNLIRYYALL